MGVLYSCMGCSSFFVAAYVMLSILIYWPYRMWKEQRAKIAALMLPGDPFPDMTIHALFDRLDPDGKRESSQLAAK